MSRARLLFLWLVIVLLLCGSIAQIPLIIYRQIPHFAQYEDTHLVDEKLYASFDHHSCQVNIFYKQTLKTTQTSDAFWERIPATWQNKNHEFLGYHDRARHRLRFRRISTINNQISLLRDSSVNTIFTSNSFTAHLPQTTCRILPLKSGFLKP